MLICLETGGLASLDWRLTLCELDPHQRLLLGLHQLCGHFSASTCLQPFLASGFPEPVLVLEHRLTSCEELPFIQIIFIRPEFRLLFTLNFF